MADKIRENNEYHRLKSKYLGLGNADTDREEFLCTLKRDTYASLAQHDHLLYYNSLILNEPMECVRQRMIKKMVNPLQRSEGDENNV